MKLTNVDGSLARFDSVDTEDYQASMRNLRNLFRGVAVLAMWVGMISFLFGASSLFDDLFTLTQVIFVHIFIQS